MHPLQADITTLSDNDLEDKIRELTKKYFTTLRVSPSVSTQILMLLEDYKQEQQNREMKRLEANKGDLDKDFDDLINIG
jgi:ribosomal protein L29